ncbi:UDP-N-acetylglucosamine 1-carboxyvinyltransferase [Candidatus Chloroploca asiatica]|uniref:UDP-N-acetylglucosamine 1-carboxyvinyltransferase n=1 Tax=Candidatus Chloroploca asiatica TaxID=1506545 RepID=A0A2H3KH89_9CHLR|nr:UDP-N-acetylglucosamine 1-carboxyvinyltransferase [Candidatus Chloroploca asiatica]PDV97113.1 UDP-N-acetylglucosamine 1-carboxyvinyltransferase [Candidatus Chloroploca asiatica]
MASDEFVYRIRGGEPVVGHLTALGAKNFATKAMVAALLADTPTQLLNCPPIGDVVITHSMLEAIGAKIHADGTTLTIDPTDITSSQVPIPDSGSNRIPILLLGALLHRFDEVAVPVVGGCRIGERPVDFHLMAIEHFGGTVTTTREGYVAHRRGRLRGTQIHLPYPSVGATETCLFLGVMAEGRSLIANAAIEPEIVELITMLRSMGAVIFTSAGREIVIEGVPQLLGTRMPILGDRIEAASWACLAGASDGDITVSGIDPNHLGNFLAHFQQVGGGFELLEPRKVRFFRRRELTPTVVETDVYPGFSTDWQQPFAIMLTQAHGISIIHETVYENRFGYLKALNELGANTQLTTHCLGGLDCRFSNQNHEHSAIIVGPTPLASDETMITIPDLRAGLAYIIAAAIARGTSYIRGIHLLERGYGDVVPRLTQMNLQIERVLR